jgi:hypothetical protein
MEMMTHLIYEDLFNNVEWAGLALPLSCLDDDRFIDEVIDEVVTGLESVETISYSSFLNMIVQTCEPDESARSGRTEIEAVGFLKGVANNKVFFHRDCLLYMMSRIIADGENVNTHTIRITGGSDRRGAMKYYKALLLINSKINKAGGDARHTFLKNYLIRDYPSSYSPETTRTIYSMRLQRYWRIYDQVLSGIGADKRDRICEALRIFEDDTGLSLREHYFVVTGILGWFLMIPVERRKRQDEQFSTLGFDYHNIGSFYVRRENFGDKDRFIHFIEHLAADKAGVQAQFGKKRKDEATGIYRHFQAFFDHPVFKIDNDSFCILDLKFLLEGLCSGLLWRLKDKLPSKDFDTLKAQYGHLLEEYFVFLINQIFTHATISNTQGSGPDCVVEFGDHLIIFEFTTEYYRFASLYSQSTELFKQDIHRLLFNEGKMDPCGRDKRDKGKLLKLNQYVDERGNKGKTVIPILVTENYLGDYDLLNQFENFLDKEITKYGLNNMEGHKPLILSLDDLETFWALSNVDRAELDFVEYIRSWESSAKGGFLYNFSYFISDKGHSTIRNMGYSEFFNYSAFSRRLSEHGHLE